MSDFWLIRFKFMPMRERNKLTGVESKVYPEESRSVQDTAQVLSVCVDPPGRPVPTRAYIKVTRRIV